MDLLTALFLADPPSARRRAPLERGRFGLVSLIYRASAEAAVFTFSDGAEASLRSSAASSGA